MRIPCEGFRVDMVETFDLGGSGVACSRAGLGGCPLGGHGWGLVDHSDLKAAVREALDGGVNFFDTADCYGLGRFEELLGRALGSRRREVIVSKVRRTLEKGETWKDASPKYMRDAVEGSLRRLRIDTIPLYSLHWPDGATAIADTIGALARCREQGKICAIGVSNLSAEQLKKAVSEADIAAIQVRGSLLRQRSFREIIDVARAHRVSVVTWGSLGEGLLAGTITSASNFASGDRRNRYADFKNRKFERNLQVAREISLVAARLGRYPSEVALRWLLDTDGIAASLFGAKRPAQVRDNLGALGWSMETAVYQHLARVGQEVELENDRNDESD